MKNIFFSLLLVFSYMGCGGGGSSSFNTETSVGGVEHVFEKQEHYYAKNSCYILDFARVWKAKCYEKGTEEKKVFYDEEAYQGILNYLKESFISVDIRI